MPRSAPSLSIQNPGTTVTSSLWNNGPKAMGDFYTGPPICRIRSTSTISTTSGAFSAIPMNISEVDSDSGHSNTVNNTRYTCQVAGWYLVEGFIAFTGGTGQYDCWAKIAKNGSDVVGSPQVQLNVAGGGFAGVSTQAFVQMAVSDFIEIWCRQDSGGTVSTGSFSDLACSMNVVWIHS